MPRKIDPEAVAERIRASVEMSQRHERRVRCHRLFEEFGFKRRTDNDSAYIVSLLHNHRVDVDPSPTDMERVGRDEWLHLTLEVEHPPTSQPGPVPRPPDEWFTHLQNLKFGSEREVEVHYVSPLFHALGYSDEHEAVGYKLDVYQGVTLTHPEADFIYFESENHSLDVDPGNPLVLVECKTPDHLDGLGQVKSYAYWVKPVYYIVTNGDILTLFLYQGGAIPDLKLLEAHRTQLAEQFDEVYRCLARENAIEAKGQTVERWKKAAMNPPAR